MTDPIYHGANRFSGLHSKVHVDESEDTFHFEHIGDVEPVLERNKAVYAGHAGWASDRTGESKSGLRHVATIPPVVMVELLNRGIDIFSEDPDQQRRLWAILNDPAWRYLRTTPGVL